MGCGKIVCVQEGSGPCFYCGTLVCTREEREVIGDVLIEIADYCIGVSDLASVYRRCPLSVVI